MKVECPYLAQFSSLRHAFFEAHPQPLSPWYDQAMEVMASRPLPL